MRFGDLLRATVLTSAGAATVLVLATVAGIHADTETTVGWVAFGWWILAALIGTWLGRADAATESIRSLLASARSQATLPEIDPARTLLLRLWPLLLVTVIAAAVAIVLPQVSAVVAGFMITWAAAWRRQAAAVAAIEDRDGARFYVQRTRFWQPIQLVRTPGFRAIATDLIPTPVS